MTDPSRLIAALADVERHVGSNGWDQPARLFALVPTGQLLEMEPHLVDRLPGHTEDSLTAIEQENFAAGVDVLERLAGIYWPQTVLGTALALERAFLPPAYEDELPDDDADVAEFVARHEAKVDARVVVGVLRDGSQHGLARLKSHPDELLGAEDLVPALIDALHATMEDPS